MKLSKFDTSISQDIIEFYKNVFSDAEGQAEGESIASLVSNLIGKTPENDLIGFVAKEQNEIAGCIFFSRIELFNDPKAYILSPVAVATEKQARGIGQRLINYGIDYLVSHKTEFIFTYGDPAYYSKTGFKQIDPSIIKAPFLLSQPRGWLAQALNGNAIETLQGNTKCVAAFNDAKYW